MAASEITLLLDEYQAMLASLPQRRRRLPFRLRYPGVGTEHFLVEHIRTVLDVVERRCRVLMAIREHDRECVSDDAQRVESFAASLPMPVSRWYVLALAALIVVVAQLLLAPASRQLADQGKGTELAQQLEKLATRQFTAPADAVQAVLHTSVYGVCTVGFCLCLAAYLVLAPLAAGLQASRAILDPPDLPTLTVWRRIRPIRVRSVERTSVAAIERRVFDKLGLSLPRESQLGLFVKAMPCVAAILLAFVVLSLYSAGVNRGRMPANSGGIVTTSAGVLVQSSASVNFDQPVGELIVALVVSGVAALRIGYLASVYRARRSRVSRRLSAYGRPPAKAPMKVRAALTSAPAWAVVSTAAVLVAFLVYDSVDRKPPSVTVTELHADTALSTRTLTLTIECDEPCWLASANIGRETVDNVGETPSWLNTDLLATPANNFASNYVHRTKTVVLSLAAPQADWLLKQFHADVAAGLQSVLDRLAVALDFVDGSGNANRVLLFLEQ